LIISWKIDLLIGFANFPDAMVSILSTKVMTQKCYFHEQSGDRILENYLPVHIALEKIRFGNLSMFKTFSK